MLIQKARQHHNEPLELVEWNEVAAVREVDAPAVAPSAVSIAPVCQCAGSNSSSGR